MPIFLNPATSEAMDEEKIISELRFKAVKSSGPGGQHVNKTASRVELYFEIAASQGLTEEEKTRVFKKLENRINSSGELLLSSEATRSQHKNKEDVINRFLEMLKASLKKPKTRKSTKPGKAAREKRLKEKKILADKKAGRKNPLL